MKNTKKYDLMAGLIICAMGIMIWKNAHNRYSTAASGVAPEPIKNTKPVPAAPRPQPAAPASGVVQMVAQAELAPAWTVKFGEEFWQRSTPDASNPARADNIHSAATPPFSLIDVIERVDHALVVGNSSQSPEVAAANYDAQFDGQGLRFSPSQPATTQGASPASDPGTELLFQTASVQRDGLTFYSAASDTAQWSAIGNTAQALLSSAYGVVEHFEAQNVGVDAAWVFSQSLPGSGPIEVTAAINGLSYAGQTDSGYHYADATGTPRVRVSNAFAVDSSGNRWQLPVTASADGSQLTITLSAEIQARAVYPLAIDPIVAPEFGMDAPVSAPASGNQNNPAIAFARTNYLVVWDDNRDSSDTKSDIYGARVTTNGVVLDPVGIAISRDFGNQTTPSVAVISNTFLVVWDDQRLGSDVIFGARVSNQGIVADPQGFALSASTAGESNPTVTAGTTNFFVAWEDQRNVEGADGQDIYGARVTPTGVILDPAGIAVSTNAADKFTPAAVTYTNGFFVVWQDNRNIITAADIYGARISNTGLLLDPIGVAISVTNGTQTVPAVAINHGTTLVVWQDRRNSGTTSDDIYGARVNFTNNTLNVLDTNGIPISTNSASQRTPTVCALTNNFLVVWSDRRNNNATSLDIFGARVDTNGLVLDTNAFVICNNAASQTLPVVASSAAGALVAWVDPRNFNTANDIYGTRISNTGAVIDQTNLLISRAGAVEANPSVAYDGTNYLVAWEDSRSFSTNDVDIRGARVSAKGALLDKTGLLICNAAGAQQHPSVAASGGEFLVAWQDDRNDGVSGEDIYGSRVSDAGVVLDPAGLALSTTNDDQLSPVVAGNASAFLVVWEDNRNNSTSPDIFGTFVSHGGGILNPGGLAIAQTGDNEVTPAIAASPTQFLVTWEDRGDVFAARVANNGTVIDSSGSALQLADFGEEQSPAVAALGNNFLVAWVDSRNSTDGIFAGRVLSDGTVPDFEGFPVCTLPDNQSSPTVGATSNNWVVVWQNTGASDGNDLLCARILANGAVQDFLSVPNLGTADRTAPAIAFGGNQFLLVSDAFRTNSARVVAGLLTPTPASANTFVQFSAANYSVAENKNSTAKITITLASKPNGPVTVDFSTADGTAVTGVDYMPVAGRLTFTANQVSTTVLIPLVNNQAVNASKTVQLNLQNPMGGALIGTVNTATLTIVE